MKLVTWRDACETICLVWHERYGVRLDPRRVFETHPPSAMGRLLELYEWAKAGGEGLPPFWLTPPPTAHEGVHTHDLHDATGRSLS